MCHIIIIIFIYVLIYDLLKEEKSHKGGLYVPLNRKASLN